ncbi:DUF599 domain-containing protein [Oxalobacteraceae bacterium R-40]|uniref:DUF599 domain-containing protein n=1 Tax=Keguizhuia sedimenti TaxID=3064264 RepID=A0ABU1BTS9_9BURK|nr:DUF599 domain-containing protein [Oxalobacteraceae bacterium R-40]
MSYPNSLIIEWVNIVGCLFVFVLYEIYLGWLIKRAPMKTARGAHAVIRSKWVKSVMNRPGSEVLAVQTLRNSVMAASFMATTAVLALSATLTLSGIGNEGNSLWELTHAADPKFNIFAVKLLLLAGSFFISFLFMAMAVRFFNHAGYLITAEGSAEELLRSQSLAIAYLNRAGNHYSFGLRSFFTCIPFLAGLFSTYLMLPGAALLILVLNWFDRIPYDEQ